jgi:hypothetical protein
MTRQPIAQKQLLTLRQAIIIISIVALMFFAFKYGRNVLRYRELQNEWAEMNANIAAVETEQKDVDRAFDESLSPAVVENFVRDELGWTRPGDEVIILVGDHDAITGVALPASPSSAEENVQAQEPKENWRLWLELLIGGE